VAALFVTAVSSFLTPYMASAVTVALPAIAREFDMSAVALSWVPLAYAMTAAVFLVPFGRAADLYGRWRFFKLGLLLHSVSTLVLTVAPSAVILLALRAIQGVGGAMLFCTSTAIVVAAFPASERGRVLGLNVAAVYLGLTLGPPSGGLLVELLGWRSIFFAAAALGLVALAIVYAKAFPEQIGASGQRYDTGGAVLYGVALLALAGALPLWPRPEAAGLLLVAAIGLALFAWQEARTVEPLLDLRRFRGNTVFVFSNLAALIHYAATFALGFLLSLYLQHLKGLSARDAGLILLAQPVVMAAGSPLAGWLSDRVQPRLVASLGMAVTAGGVGALCLVSGTTSLAFIVGVLAIVGLGFAFFSSPNTNAVMTAVTPSTYGVASAVLATMRLVGNVTSMGLVSVIMAFHLGQARLSPQVYPAFERAMRTTFPILVVLCVVGVLASLARGDVVRSERRSQG
jgi:MFS family permease